MKSNLLITRLTEKDIEGAYELFKITILIHLKNQEVNVKRN